MEDAVRLLAGDCTVTYRGTDTVTQRGAVLVLVKPDDTVLVHDADGYQPAAWLTRGDTVEITRGDDGFTLAAAKDDATLRVESHTTAGDRYYPVSQAGETVGDCPDCAAVLVHTGATITCTGCQTRYPIPRDATLTGDRCPDCALPTMTVERGATFDVCIDADCDPLDAAVAAQFDSAWPCPDCGTGMTIATGRGLRATCPACETTVPVPRGTITGECPCGLPLFSTADATRCFDPGCPRREDIAP
ncbi:MAG: DUF91 domain-containing protein [Halobacteriaceae archaeon]